MNLSLYFLSQVCGLKQYFIGSVGELNLSLICISAYHHTMHLSLQRRKEFNDPLHIPSRIGLKLHWE